MFSSWAPLPSRVWYSCCQRPSSARRAELAALPVPRTDEGRIVLAVDVSPWLRSDAPTSADRLFCHVYGRAKSVSQFIPGWPYSFVVALESGRTSWTGILDAVRLGPEDDATAVTADADLDSWSARHLTRLAAAERDWHRDGSGVTLLHADLRPDNTILAVTGDVAIDWAYLHQGAAWVDPAMFLHHLIRAGHTPAQAEAAMTAVTAWTDAPADTLTSFAIALTGYWERSSRYPGPPGVPYLRTYQAQMAANGRQWIQHRTDWT